jgi:hypothetical protein
MRVAAVDASNKVVLKTVKLGRDLGNSVEIQSGVSLADRLIDNPQESIEEGATVRIAGSDAKSPAVAAVKAPAVAAVEGAAPKSE